MSAPALDRYVPPPSLSWAGNASYFVRLVVDISEGGKATKRAVCLTQAMLYMCDPKGNVSRAVKIPLISEIILQDMKKGGVLTAKTTEKHVLLKVPSEYDILLCLTPDKANGPDGNNDDRFMEVLIEIGRAAGTQFKITTMESDSTERITDKAVYTKADGYVDTKVLLEAKIKEKELNESIVIGSSPDTAAASPGLNTKAGDMCDSTVVALSARIRDLETQLAASKASPQKANSSANTEEKVQQLTKQLEEEKASREDMVRDMRADFDTQFIKKQAEEFELRQRTHQRIRDKDLAKIKELEERLSEPRAYNGAAEHLQRIQKLEGKLEEMDGKLDEALSRATHFENVCDEQYLAMKRYWEFIQDGALPRIRDLQAGKDHRKLPLLPKLPLAPAEPQSFVYDPANKPVRKAAVHADTSFDFDLELSPKTQTAPILDDLDLDFSAPAAQPAGGIDLDDDLL
eukprot:TRINITY_DN33880_c0_g1_i1.p1 TRINITY_DN33880_c0_g1~~TRINITY_DN33880_c0_g1_i1.p1  ORF type:complete len:459 (+),score=135.06 TRINITY_DN33880_c0_g1_i1:55-1431(+)